MSVVSGLSAEREEPRAAAIIGPTGGARGELGDLALTAAEVAGVEKILVVAARQWRGWKNPASWQPRSI
jgi:hypothetical protein